jgi:ribosomal protein S18 acetylase RimI-like enzyme
MQIENAKKEQARELAFLINLAGEGIAEYLWSGMVQGDELPMDIGAMRAAREDGGFSYKNALVCVSNGELQGMIVSYRQPQPYEIGDVSEYSEIIRPLVLLESQAPGSWYINAIATFEQYRGLGVAQKLLQKAEECAKLENCEAMSLIVASESIKAKRLYTHLGYKEVSSLPVVPYPGCLHAGQWILMTKQLKYT